MSVKLFDTATTTPAPAKNFSGSGRGRKQCPSCKQYVGVRTKQCACKHSFERKKGRRVEVEGKPANKKSKTKDALSTSLPSRERLATVIAPAGKCPFVLAGTSYEEVMGWAQAVRGRGFDKSEYYTVSALKYYARYFFDIFSDDYLIVEGHLENINKVGNEPDTSAFYQRRLATRMGEVFGSIALGYQNRNK